MNLKKAFGGLLIATPFIGITVYVVIAGGWLSALIAWGVMLAILALFVAGCYLLDF